MRASWFSPQRSAGLLLVASAVLAGAATAGQSAPDSMLDTSRVPFASSGSALPDGWYHGAFAEIFVRSYRDSDGDGIGDLRGLTQSLDHLHELGVRGLWLMPVTRSGDHDHGYAVSDYRDIEPAYGTLADFDDLLKQAHARGIGVIVDYVINHSAASNPIFMDAAASTASPYRSWYMWRDSAPTGWRIMDKDPWVDTPTGAYLAQFSRSMPDFNLLDPDALAYHEDNLRFWLNRGVDGFRFDAVIHLVENGRDAWQDQPENYRVMGRLRALVARYPNRYVVCEAARNAFAYAAPEACGTAFELGGGATIVAAARGNRAAIRKLADYFAAAPEGMATLVSNHDQYAGERLWDQVQGKQARYRLAAASYLLLPGTPFIYYGEEIGMSAAQRLQGDPRLRAPMSWTADPATAGFTTGRPYREPASNVAQQNVANQRSAPDSLLAWYTALLQVRNRYPAISRGNYQAPSVQGRVFSHQRRLGGQLAVVVINYGTRPAIARLRGLPAGGHLSPVLPDSESTPLIVGDDGSAAVKLRAQSVLVFVSASDR